MRRFWCVPGIPVLILGAEWWKMGVVRREAAVFSRAGVLPCCFPCKSPAGGRAGAAHCPGTPGARGHAVPQQGPAGRRSALIPLEGGAESGAAVLPAWAVGRRFVTGLLSPVNP